MRAVGSAPRAGRRGGPPEFNPCRALRQRVTHVLVALGEELLLLVRAGQRVAAVVGAHVQGGIHWVGEVGGLRTENYTVTQRAVRRSEPL